VPVEASARQPAALLLLNDGQDLERMGFKDTLEKLYAEGALRPVLAVGIYANERRMREYGVVARPDYQGRGDLAGAYEQFILQELLPWLYGRYPLSGEPGRVYFAGFSLGGLSAFDLVWRNPRIFGGAGVFSGSLWWRARPFDPHAPDADRIAHHQVAEAHDVHPHLRFWFQAGTEDETSDRNNNGIIDAIDDTLDLMRQLEARGYRKGIDLTYVEVDGGRHEPATWGKVMGVFLRWAFV
jgi:enterochelin esterase-like enzyme